MSTGCVAHTIWFDQKLNHFSFVPSEERFLTGPIMVFGDRLLDALCWPANKPYADRLCDIWVLWPAMISQDFPCFLSRIFLAIFYLYADRPLLCFCYMLTGQVQSPWLYILWTFIFGLVFAVWWPTYFCSLASTYRISAKGGNYSRKYGI